MPLRPTSGSLTLPANPALASHLVTRAVIDKLLSDVSRGHGDTRVEKIEAFVLLHALPGEELPGVLKPFSFDQDRERALLACAGRVTGTIDLDAVRASFSHSSSGETAVKRFLVAHDEAMARLHLSVSVRAALSPSLTQLLATLESSTTDGRRLDAVRAFARDGRVPAEAVPFLLAPFELDRQRQDALLLFAGRIDGALVEQDVIDTFEMSARGKSAIEALARQQRETSSFVSVRVSVEPPHVADARALIARVVSRGHNATKTDAIREFARTRTFPAALIPELLASYTFDSDRANGLLALRGRVDGVSDERAIKAAFTYRSTADDAWAGFHTAPALEVRGGVTARVSFSTGEDNDALMLINRVRASSFDSKRTEAIATFVERRTFPAHLVDELLAAYAFDGQRVEGARALSGKLSGPVDETQVRGVFSFRANADAALRALR
jgi:hypothetical protein